MISSEQQDELINQSFERFEAKGKEWVSVDDDLAPDYMLHHPDYQRRRRATDFIRKMLRIPRKEEPTKASIKYRHEVEGVLLGMDDRGEIEPRFLNENGELPETPPEGILHSSNRRYRRIPAELAGKAA